MAVLAWYEWFPEASFDFTGISFSAGDSVTATVTATSKTGGVATIKNNSKGTSVSHTFSGQPSLCQFDAEWIVEDFEENGQYSPLLCLCTVTHHTHQAVSFPLPTSALSLSLTRPRLHRPELLRPQARRSSTLNRTTRSSLPALRLPAQ